MGYNTGNISKITKEELPYLRGEYLANIKYDGERVMSFIKDGEVIMVNRRGKVVNFHFQEIEKELKQLSNCVIDGEIISHDNVFEKLQSRALTKDKFKQESLMKTIPCNYMIFDIIEYGKDKLMFFSLKERLTFLNKIGLREELSHLKLCEYKPIDEMLKLAEGCEGIIIKDMKARYEPRRSKSWLKLKFFQETQITITHYTLNNAGIRAEDNEGNAIQISGQQSYPIKQKLDAGQQVEVYVQYLTKGKEGRMRFPSFRGCV